VKEGKNKECRVRVVKDVQGSPVQIRISSVHRLEFWIAKILETSVILRSRLDQVVEVQKPG
jgi:hypothetical protein